MISFSLSDYVEGLLNKGYVQPISEIGSYSDFCFIGIVHNCLIKLCNFLLIVITVLFGRPNLRKFWINYAYEEVNNLSLGMIDESPLGVKDKVIVVLSL